MTARKSAGMRTQKKPSTVSAKAQATDVTWPTENSATPVPMAVSNEIAISPRGRMVAALKGLMTSIQVPYPVRARLLTPGSVPSQKRLVEGSAHRNLSP